MLDELDMMNSIVESIQSFARDDAKGSVAVNPSALVEGICEDAADAGEKVTFSRTAGRNDILPTDGHATGDLQSAR
jgi:hypothetical protein